MRENKFVSTLEPIAEWIPDRVATEKEIIAFCKQNLAHYKVPKYVEFSQELPKTLVGKVLRRELGKEEAGG